jgi:prepilin-type N-terminal cleavage/methylation domain-containing protein
VPKRPESGFTIIEVLIAMLLFSVVSTSAYRVLFSAANGSKTAQNVVNVSEEARLGFNRMVRDTREADTLSSPTSTSFQVQTDFDANGVIDASPTDAAGNYESLTFTFNPSGNKGTITVSNGSTSEVLMKGVAKVAATQEVFTYTSSRLEYENVTSACGTSPATSIDGVATWVELDQSSIGNKNCTLDSTELSFVDGVNFSIKVTVGNSFSTFFDQAQLRNQR